MTTHLSSRLVWHDRAWDGHICDHPGENAYCVVQKHIREELMDTRNLEREDKAAGLPLCDLDSWQPPCSRDPIAFSPIGYTITHYDPLDFRRLPPATEGMPPYSVCASPYRWMREENFRQICEDEKLDIRGPDEPKKQSGWIYEPDRQIALLTNFWGRLEKGHSLIFFYCNHGNPLEENLNRVLIGAGRVSRVGQQLFFGKKPPQYTDDYPVWSRCIVHDFKNQGFRLPYHEYLRSGYDVSNIVCRIPEGAMLDFSYVSEHVSDDTAVGVLEGLLQSVEAVRRQNLVPGDWTRHITWINDVLAEVWQDRGPFPGIGSVLQFLGVEMGTAFHRRSLLPRIRKRQDPWAYLLSILEGRAKCEEREYAKVMAQAAERWAAYAPARRDLLRLLTRFELTPTQVRRIASSTERASAGIDAGDEDLVANPYIISEMDQGGEDYDPVPLDVIDRGMRPEGDAALFLRNGEGIPQDDPRRVRGCAVTVLKEASTAGDTLLTFTETLNRIRTRFPERRACLPDSELVIGQKDFYQEAIDFRTGGDPPSMALLILSELEKEVRDRLVRRVARKNEPPRGGFSWDGLLRQEFAEGKGSHLPPEVEERARAEKARALDVLYTSRFSVLTGRAGTGKTSVMRVFLNGLEELEGKKPVLMLAPTGKARVRLMERTKRKDGTTRDAYTIHQFLMRNNWVNPQNFALRYQGGTQGDAPTVIIDEASMLPMDLLGVLFRALDLNKVTRLVLVGDPNQLPPIGPGRPFVDILSWLKADDVTAGKHYPEDHRLTGPQRRAAIAELTERARHENHDSVALQLADVYLSENPTPGDDDILSRTARRDVGGDLEVNFWQDEADLLSLLSDQVDKILCQQGEGPDYQRFSESLGISTGKDKRYNPRMVERWQILSPVRNHVFGTTEINRKIQAQFRGGLLARARRTPPRPFGEQELVWTDKVIQIVNCRRDSRPHGTGLNYVANGEIGLVVGTSRDRDCLDVAYCTQPESTYRYYRSETDGNLELAYALTVHKSQGSDFDTVFFVLPHDASTLSKELLYTGLTRFRKKMVLLIERDTETLLTYRRPEASATLLRNTSLFLPSLRQEAEGEWYSSHLIHRTATGVLVRSKSEVIVADTLTRLGISYEYEKRLPGIEGTMDDFRLPDFTVSYEGDSFYWEHLGMLSVPSYREQWERKREWYEKNGYRNQLIISEDGPDGSIDSTTIEQLARERIIG